MVNRELKFRTWDGEKFHYFYIEDLVSHSLRSLFPEHIKPFQTIQQFIGKLDKAGNEIFDGDILSAPFATGGGATAKSKHFNVKVKWFPSEYQITFPDNAGNYRYYPRIEDCTIVGNIIEDPNLVCD